MESNLQVLLLHNQEKYLDGTADLINTYWSRSKAARLWTLEKSCDKLPCSIILVLTENGKEEVIGHSRVVEAQGADNACYVETVVVKSDLRGRGFGRRLMEESEKFASCKGYKQMFLNTIDKEKFYSHLGYTESHPVITLGANASKLPQHMIDKLTQTTTRCTPSLPPPTATALPPPSNTVGAPPHPNPNDFTITTAAPPPPPPLPPTSKKCQPTEGCNTHVMELCCDPSKVTWMRKDLIPKVSS
ncbi:hypothetical protein SNE40_010305 [Patella caerulea]|uniref:N-acetyltransferase domain-containing protein n=1 Tax=Patella caerulea TaxID=87958 RepID=A0AAN8K0S2_PATCE